MKKTRKSWILELFDAEGNFDIKGLPYWPRQDLTLLLHFPEIRRVLAPYPIIYLADAYDLPNNPTFGIELIISSLDESNVLSLSIALSEILETHVRVHPLTFDRLDYLSIMLVNALPLEKSLIRWHLQGKDLTPH